MNEIITVLNKIKDAGHHTITIEYSGGGDSGQIDETLGDKEISLTKDFREECDVIESWAYENILNQIGDWWNNDGGRGILTFDLDTMTYQTDETYYFTDSRSDSHSGELVDIV